MKFNISINLLIEYYSILGSVFWFLLIKKNDQKMSLFLIKILLKKYNLFKKFKNEKSQKWSKIEFYHKKYHEIHTFIKSSKFMLFKPYIYKITPFWRYFIEKWLKKIKREPFLYKS
jgi:hypothetical protein